MNFKINVKPLSVNSLFKGRRFKTDKYNSYEKECMLLMPSLPKNHKFSDMLKVDLIFGFSSKLADVDNPTKAVLDILQKKYGFNDRDVWEINLQKKIVVKGDEFINVEITNLLPFTDGS